MTMKTELDELNKPVLTALVLGVLFTLVFGVYMWWTTRQNEVFTEVYFGDNRNLPVEMRLNRTYNVSFTLTNHELEPATYVYEVDSTVENFTDGLTLGPDESKTINLGIVPAEKTGNISWRIESTRFDRFMGVSNLTTEPITFDITGFGGILNENLTVERLEREPVSSYVEESIKSLNRTEYRSINRTLMASGGQVLLKSSENHVVYLSAKKPFIIKVYKRGDRRGDELEIYYWLAVK